MESRFNAVALRIAEAHGISVEQVWREMDLVVEAARNNPDPTAKAKFAQIPCKGDSPTTEEFMAYILKRVQDAK